MCYTKLEKANEWKFNNQLPAIKMVLNLFAQSLFIGDSFIKTKD